MQREAQAIIFLFIILSVIQSTENMPNPPTEPVKENGDKDERSRWLVGGLVVCASLIALAGVVNVQKMETARESKQIMSLVGKSRNAGKELNYKTRSEYGSKLPNYNSFSSNDLKSAFEEFKSKYSKSYKDEDEETARFDIFKSNLLKADERNGREGAVNGRGVHGITKFSDYTQKEFAALLGGANIPSRPSIADESSESSTNKEVDSATDVTYSNWIGSLTTAVNDQGACGGCWAFSAVQQMESDAMRKGYISTDDAFSVEQVIDCDDVDFGCAGGNTEGAYGYVQRNGGIRLASEYPYSSSSGTSQSTCNDSSGQGVVTVDLVKHIYDEASMIDYVLTEGPLSVCLDADIWDSYSDGIVHDCGTEADHCVQIVGVNTVENYWIVRNSWGPDWGIDGYILLNLNNNTCVITTDPTYTVVSVL